ncbi:hypothetical protein JHK82_042573 [Glycine max]|nr:hypothetical protein JHK85_043234 [Glycine max]KAG5105603.1 hypothetical protein JHK82_042573 [Glycine max]
MAEEQMKVPETMAEGCAAGSKSLHDLHHSDNALLLRDPTHGGVLYTHHIWCVKRTKKQMYSYEKKKVMTKQKEILSNSKEKSKFKDRWSLFKLIVPLDQDPKKDFFQQINVVGAMSEVEDVVVAAQGRRGTK